MLPNVTDFMQALIRRISTDCSNAQSSVNTLMDAGTGTVIFGNRQSFSGNTVHNLRHNFAVTRFDAPVGMELSLDKEGDIRSFQATDILTVGGCCSTPAGRLTEFDFP